MTEADAYCDLTPLSEDEFDRFADRLEGMPVAYRQFLAETGWGALAGENLALFQAPEPSSSFDFRAGQPNPYFVFGDDMAGYLFAFIQGAAEVYGFQAGDRQADVIAPDFTTFMRMKIAEV